MTHFFLLKDVFDMPSSRWQMRPNYEPWYIGWANCDTEAGAILRQYYETPFFLPAHLESGKRDWVFMGTPGYGAPFHLDNVKYPSWQAQVQITFSFFQKIILEKLLRIWISNCF